MDTNMEEIRFMNSANIIESQEIYDGVILRLYRNKVRLEDGQEAYRELIHHDDAVGILAIDNQDRVLLVKQYRSALDDAIYEIPAGLIDRHNGIADDPLETAKRELEEETAYQAKEWRFLDSFYVSPGYLDEQIYLFYAHELTEVENPLPLDEGEFLTVHAFTRHEIQEMIEAREIQDLKTLYALKLWLLKGGL